MNNIRHRKYARTAKKNVSPVEDTDSESFSISSRTALGLLGGTFLVGLVSGKLLGLSLRRWH